MDCKGWVLLFHYACQLNFLGSAEKKYEFLSSDYKDSFLQNNNPALKVSITPYCETGARNMFNKEEATKKKLSKKKY